MPQKKRIQTKSFQEYIETRFTKAELVEIEAEVEREVAEFRKCQLDHILLRPVGYGGHAPNAATRKAIKDARKRKNFKSCNSMEELLEELRK